MTEETGYEIEKIEELGEIIEYHTKREGSLKNQCLGYKAKIVGEKQERTLTEREEASGQEIIWLDYKQALTKVTTNKSGIVKERALLLLKLALNN